MGPSTVGRRPERLRGRRAKGGGKDEDGGINLNMGRQRKKGGGLAAAAAAAAAAWTVSSQSSTQTFGKEAKWTDSPSQPGEYVSWRGHTAVAQGPRRSKGKNIF